MGLLLNLKDDVTSLDARSLVTLTAELNLGAAANALVDVNVKDPTPLVMLRFPDRAELCNRI